MLSTKEKGAEMSITILIWRIRIVLDLSFIR